MVIGYSVLGPDLVTLAATGFLLVQRHPALALANELPAGVTINNVLPGYTATERLTELKAALSARTGVDYTVLELRLRVVDAMRELDMDPAFADRYLNEGFSGGEKKRNEIFQMAMLDPSLVIMDETDSGLDIDALRIVSDAVNKLRDGKRSFLVITHYQRLLEYIVPDVVHVLSQGKIVKSGGKELALELEEKGYDWIIKHEPVAA